MKECTKRTPRVTQPAAGRNAQLRKVTQWTVLLLCGAAVFALAPLWQPLLLAAFAAIALEPVYRRLYRRINGRASAAAVLTLLLAVFALVPMIVAALTLYQGGVDLLMRLRHSSGGYDALRELVASEQSVGFSSMSWDAGRLMALLQEHGWSAFTTARTVFGAATDVVVGLFIFALGFYTLLVKGKRAWAWLLDRSPLPHAHGARFAAAFVETGRGLLIGVGLTALIQGAVATIAYFAIGVSHAAVLGVLTALAALIPSVGTALVWVPVTAGLFLAERTQAGMALLVTGFVVSIIDNVIRPWLSRYAKLELSTFLLLVAMLGGMSAFGGFGLLLGPLLVRLAVEGLRLLHDEREATHLRLSQPAEQPTSSMERPSSDFDRSTAAARFVGI